MSQNIYSDRQAAIILQIVILLMGGFIVYALWPYQAGFVGALIVYAIFKKWFIKNVHERGRNKLLYIISIMLISFVVIIIPILTLLFMIADKIYYYTNNYGELVQLVKQIQASLPIEVLTPDVVNNVLKSGAEFVSSLFSSLLNQATGIVINITMMYVILFFMLYKQNEFHNAMYKYIPLEKEEIDLMRDEFRTAIDAFITGQGIISLVQGASLGIGFWLFGYPDAIFWSLVAFFLSFIPVVGPSLIWIPAGLLGIISENEYNGWGIILWGALFVTNIDNVLRFVLAKRFGDVPPLITILGVLIGIPFFGLMGLVLGPLILIYFLILVDIYVKNSKHLKPTSER